MTFVRKKSLNVVLAVALVIAQLSASIVPAAAQAFSDSQTIVVCTGAGIKLIKVSDDGSEPIETTDAVSEHCCILCPTTANDRATPVEAEGVDIAPIAASITVDWTATADQTLKSTTLLPWNSRSPPESA